MNSVEITKEMFDMYNRVRRSGITNMFNIRMVGDLSGLDKEEILQIMHGYSELREKFGEEQDYEQS
jgi:hypothetical protein